MRGLWYVLFLVLGTGLVAACDRDEESGGIATAPSLASAASQCSNLNQKVQAAFTDNTTRQNVQAFAQSMVQAFGQNEKGKATWYGFQILEAIDTAGRLQGTLVANSNLAIATFPCMSLGNVTLPSSLTNELGPSGAFAVRGRPPEDFEAVLSHNGTWILEPSDDASWQDIATLPIRTGIALDTADLFLVLGKPGVSNNYTADGDQLKSGVFEWTTLPTVTWEDPLPVVGECTVENGFVQHFPHANSSAEVLGFVQPRQCPDGLALEPAPRSLAERLFRVLSPAPAYAALAVKGSGSKTTLSPFAIINPGKVNLGSFFQSPKKSGNFTNVPFTPTPIVKPKSNGGVPFKQSDVLGYLNSIVNNGTPGFVCFNWAYNDDEGVLDFPNAVYTKAGGISLFATTKGTSSAPAPTGESVPLLEAGLTATSTAFQVKNNGTTLTVCPVFDGTTYFTNILDPTAAQITFIAGDVNTFPPNYDEVPFPGYDF